MKYKRLRRIREARKMINQEYNLNLTYYYIKNLYEQEIIKGIRFNKTIYIYYDDLIKRI